MQRFDINQPATPGQLAALFTGGGADPQAVQSNLFTTDSRLADWAQRSGNAAGIGDPVAFFRGQQAQQQMAQQQAYGDQAQLAGYDRNISPEFVRRNQFQSQLDAANQQREVARLQTSQQQALQNNPIGPASNATTLMSRANEGNHSYVDHGNQVSLINQNQRGPVDPETLYADPRFQMHSQHDPAHAAHLFEAYTGQPLALFAKGKAAAANEFQKYSQTELQKKAAQGDIRHDPKTGMWEEIQMIPDPMKPGSLTKGGWGPLSDTTMSLLNKGSKAAFPDIAEFDALRQKKAIVDSYNADQNFKQNAGMQPATIPTVLTRTGRLVPKVNSVDPMQAMAVNNEGTITGGIGRSLSDIGDLLQFNPIKGNGSYVAPQPGGVTPAHLRALVAANPQWQDLLKKNPQEARNQLMQLRLKRGSGTPNAILPSFENSTAPDTLF